MIDKEGKWTREGKALRMITTYTQVENDILSLKLIYYGPKSDILDYWGTPIFCLLPCCILSKDKGLQGLNNRYGVSLGRFSCNNAVSGKMQFY